MKQDKKMHDLVKLAIEAHGGLEQWSQISRISAAFNVSGPSFKQRGPIGEAFAALPMRVSVNTREQQTIFEPFVAPSQKGIYQPLRTAIESLNGVPVEALNDPRESLKMKAPGTPWSGPQILYFIGYSLWMYLTLPFSLLISGVQCEEVEPWVEEGEKWRALKVTYPPSYPSHSTEQIHYFDDRGLMRRQDYTVDVRQGLSAAHYIYEHRTFDGIVFPTKRRIYSRGTDRIPLRDRLLISADLDDFRLWL
jgi:hypothetical protein